MTKNSHSYLRTRSRGLSTADRLLRMRVPMPPQAWMSISCECCVCYQVEVSATGRSLIQRVLPNILCHCVPMQLHPSTTAAGIGRRVSTKIMFTQLCRMIRGFMSAVFEMSANENHVISRNGSDAANCSCNHGTCMITSSHWY